MTSKTIHRIAVIPGDGIGKEVVPEGLRVLEAVERKYGCRFAFDAFDFASCDYYLAHGQMMPDDWKAQIGGHDAIFFGAVGWPESVPDHVSLWGSLIQFRREFDQYVNLRPRSEEHTSELQSLMRISYAVFCLKKKNTKVTLNKHNYTIPT